MDTISYYDIISQRRTEQIGEIPVSPAAEIMPGNPAELAEKIEQLASGLRGKYAAAARQNLLSDCERLRGGGRLGSYDKYIPLIYEKPATLFDYAQKNGALLVVSELNSVRERLRTFEWQISEI